MKKFNVIIDTIEPLTKTLSIKIDGWEIVDGELKIVKERQGFQPGQLLEVEKMLTRFEIDLTETKRVLDVLWTQDIIDQYQQRLKQNEDD